MKTKYYFIPKIPLDACKPNNADRYLAEEGWLEGRMRVHNNPKSLDDYHLPSIKEHGQLDPLIVKHNGEEWIIEPGQSRWFILHYLGEKHTFMLVKVDTEKAADDFEKVFAVFEHKEIKTMEEAKETFGLLHSHHHKGIGYLKRKNWFKVGEK